MSEITLSKGQEEVVAAIENHNKGFLFVTGKAGTGKSVSLRAYTEKNPSVILAPTGLAAVNVGGMTVHKFFKIKPGAFETKRAEALDETKKNILKKCRIIIDEVSMVRADLVDYMDAILKRTFHNDEPFGGVPVVAFGDPFQIEPIVASTAEKEMIRDRYNSAFFFDSAVLSGGFKSIELKDVFRQTEERFINALNDIRTGEIKGLGFFDKCIKKPTDTSVKLSLTNWKADSINNKRLGLIEADETVCYASVSGNFPENSRPAPEVLKLKPGARIMTVANTEDFVNGDMGHVVEVTPEGVVIELDNELKCMVPKFKWETIEYEYIDGELQEEVTGIYIQYPLRLAWSVTSHKAQGQTYDEAHLLLDTSSFAHGQTYVALSRCRTLAGLTIARPLKPSDLVVSRRVRDWYKETFR